MQLPSFWTSASFTIAESAALIGAHEDALRNWLAHSTTKFVGTKIGRRVYLSGKDVFYWSLVHQFTSFGVPVRTAMLTAMTYANAAEQELPREKFLTVRTDGESTHFALTDEPSFSRSTLVIPLREHALDLIVQLGLVYVRDDGVIAKPIKLGTAAGQPIEEWRAAIEAELARMEASR